MNTDTLPLYIKQHDGTKVAIGVAADAILASDWAVANRSTIRLGGAASDEACIDRAACIDDARELTDSAAAAVLRQQRDNGRGEPRNWKAMRTATLAALKLRRATR